MLPSGTVSFNQEISEFRQTPAFSLVWAPLAPSPSSFLGLGELGSASSGKTLGNLFCLARLFSGVLVVTFCFSHQVSLPSLSLLLTSARGCPQILGL